MKITTLKLHKAANRSIFIIENKKTGENLVVSNRQIINQWIKDQPGFCYILKGADPIRLTSYSQLAKALIKAPTINIFFVIIAPFSRVEYTIHKLPLLREL